MSMTETYSGGSVTAQLGTPVGEVPTAPPDKGGELSSLSHKERKEMLAMLNTWFKRCKDDRATFERQWYINMAFYFGKQYVQWLQTGTNSRLYEPPAPAWRVRMVVNKVRRAARTELSKLTREKPQAFVIPASTDDDEIAAARAAENICDFEMRELGWNKVLRRAVFWEILCGSSFIKTYWDAESVDPSGIPGKICLEPVTAFHLLAPILQEEEIENQPYLIHAATKPVEYVETLFGEKCTPDSNTAGSMLEQKFLSALSIGQGSPNSVLVKECWLKPCPKYPQGAFFVWVDEKLLYFQSTWPYEKPAYPFMKLDHIPTGRFYADSIIIDLIPLQREMNRTRSQIVESKNRMAKPQLMAFQGSVDPSKITSEPGLIIAVKPGYQMPVPLPMQDLPNYVTEEVERINRDFDDLSAVNEVTRGQTPPGVEAAAAIAYLQEENDNIFGPSVSSIEEATEKAGQWILWFVANYWEEPRKINVLGENRIWEAFSYTQASIQNNFSYHVEAGSAAPRSKAGKQAFLTEMATNGWITPEQLLKYMDMVETGKLYEDQLVNQRHVQRENFQMSRMEEPPQMNPQMMQLVAQKFGIEMPPVEGLGMPGMEPGMEQMGGEIDPMTGQPMAPAPPSFPINIFDDTEFHIVEHSNYCKTQEFESLPQFNKDIILRHLQEHMMKQQTDLMAQQMGLPETEAEPGQSGQQEQGEYQ